MNIDFNKIAEFCVTKIRERKLLFFKEISLIIPRVEALTDLISSLFVNKIYEPFKIIVPAILQSEI